MNFYCMIMGMVFFIIGISFWIGRAPNWIKAWNSMTQEERQHIRIERLSKNAGCVFFIASLVFIASGIFPVFRESAFIWCMILWLLITGADIYFIGKSKRYYEESEV